MHWQMLLQQLLSQALKNDIMMTPGQRPENTGKEFFTMKKYVCDVCGYVYDEAEGDPDNGVAAGTKWEDVPEDWVCPLCGVGKDQFSEEA